MLNPVHILDLETRLLIVDDDPGIREPTATFLSAHGYVAKPANPRDLLARIRSVLCRDAVRTPNAPATTRPVLRFVGWRLDAVARELFDPDDVITILSDGEFRLLMTFADHPRRVLTRDFLLDHSHGVSAEHFDRVIDVQVSRLRRKLARDSKDGGGEELIRTIRNEGYMFAADVERR